MSMLEQLLGKVSSLDNEVKTINKRLDNLEQGQTELIQGQERTESKIDSIQKHLTELDSKNADRHVVINGKLNELSTALTVVEAVTGKNMTDIANIKLVK